MKRDLAFHQSFNEQQLFFLQKWLPEYLNQLPMPAHKAKGTSKKAIAKAVSENMHELAKSKTKRPFKQRIAIAFSEARGGKPRYKMAKKNK